MKPVNPGLKVTLVGAASNILLSVIKFIGGILGNSTAMMADAVHSLSDLLTDAVVLFTHKIGRMPKDEEHPYGHGRAESLGAVLVGAIIILAGIGLGYETYTIVASGQFRIPGWIAALSAVLSIAINEGIFRYTLKVGEKIHSPSIIANAWHHRSDAISSIAALIGIVAGFSGYPIMDPIAGAIVGLLIIRVGYKIVAEGISDLMDTAVSEDKTEVIRQAIDEIHEVMEFHDLRTRRMGGKVFMDVHILVDPDLTVTEGHKIAESVRRKLIKTMDNIEDVLVHVDAEDDSEVEVIYKATRSELHPIIDPILLSFDDALVKTRLQVHYVKGKTIVDLFLKRKDGKSISENLIQELSSRLEELSKVDRVRIYLDVNDND
jgi:cation diffusion facilitator family transporter